MLSDGAIRERVTEIVRVVLGAAGPSGSIQTDSPEWDSLRRIEIILAVEEEFDVSVPEEEFASLHSIDSISSFLTTLRAPR